MVSLYGIESRSMREDGAKVTDCSWEGRIIPETVTLLSAFCFPALFLSDSFAFLLTPFSTKRISLSRHV